MSATKHSQRTGPDAGQEGRHPPAGALTSMCLKLAAGDNLVAAVAQDASEGVQAWPDVYLPLQQQTLLGCAVLHWLPMLQLTNANLRQPSDV